MFLNVHFGFYMTHPAKFEATNAFSFFPFIVGLAVVFLA